MSSASQSPILHPLAAPDVARDQCENLGFKFKTYAARLRLPDRNPNDTHGQGPAHDRNRQRLKVRQR